MGQQIEHLKRQITQKETMVVNYEGEFKNKITMYEGNLNNLTKINEELQRKLAEIDLLAKQRLDQINKLNANWKNSSGEYETLKRQFK